MEITPGTSIARNDDLDHSDYTYCRTEVLSKTFTSVWDLHEFWTVYESVTILQMNTSDGRLPFNIFLKVNRKDEKFAFYVKSVCLDKHFTYTVLLQSVMSDRCYTIPPRYIGDHFVYEVTRSLLAGELWEYVSKNTLRVIVKACHIQHVIHNTIYTKAPQEHGIVNCDSDLNVFITYSSSAFITFKVIGKDVRINRELLCARSELFKELLKADPERYKEIYVDDMPIEVVITFKHFIQHGCTSVLKYVDVHGIFLLFEMAKRFHVDKLKQICEQYLKQFLLKEDYIFQKSIALDMLCFSYKNDAKDLLELAINFVAINANDFMHTDQFSDIMNVHPELFSILCEAKLKKVSTHGAYYQFSSS